MIVWDCLPGLDVFLVVHLGEDLDLDDLQDEEHVAKVGGRILRLADVLDALGSQRCDSVRCAAHY